MVIRAKFCVTSIITTGYAPGQFHTKVVLEPRYGLELAEDVRFCKATPSGRMEMAIDNPFAIAEMEIGRTFYVDFTPVETL